MNLNPYSNYYYQFWMVPNMMNTGGSYYTPVVMYPQLVHPEPSNLIINPNFVHPTPNLPQLKDKADAKNESKTLVEEVAQKSEIEKITVQLDSSISKQIS